MTATRRTEQRRLLSFIKLLDYMICDTLRVVLTDSMTHFLAMTRQCTEEQFEMPLPPHRVRVQRLRMKLTLQRMVRAVNRNSREQSTSKKAKEAEAKRRTQELAQEAQREAQYQMEEDKLNVFDPKYPVLPAFEVELVLRDQALAFTPAVETFQAEIEQTIGQFPSTLATLRRLPHDEILMSKMADASAADATSSETPDLVDLIDDEKHRELVRR